MVHFQSHGDSSQVKDLWFLFLFPCPLIKLAVRCPEADASPTDCQARKKIHLHWLLYLQWFLKPSKKTTVILASKQLKSTGAGSMHSPKINMTWEERGVGEQRKVLFIQRNLFLLNICNVQPIAQEATWPYFPTNGRAGWSWADAWVACGVRRTVCQEDQYLLFFYLCGESLLFLKKKKWWGLCFNIQSMGLTSGSKSIENSNDFADRTECPPPPAPAQWWHVQCFKE